MSSGQRRAKVSDHGDYVLDIVGVCVIACPLAIGSVHIESQLILAAVIACITAFVWLRPGAALPRLAKLGWVALAWLAWSLLLLAPWPQEVVSWMAPENLDAYRSANQIFALERPAALVLDRGRGAGMILTLLIYGMTAIAVWGRSMERHREHQSTSRLPLYVIFAGVLCALVTVSHTLAGATTLYGLYTPSHSLAHEPIRGPMVNPNHTAAFLLLSSSVTFAYWLRTKTRRLSMVLGGAWLLMLSVIILSASRANIALTIASHGYLLWLLRGQRTPDDNRLGWTLTALVAIIGGLFIAAGGTHWWAALTGSSQGASNLISTELFGRWATGWQVLWERPLLGHGPGNFSMASSAHTVNWQSGYLNRPHNLVLQLASEWGVPIALVLLSLGSYWMMRVLKATRSTPSHHAIAVGLTALAIQNMVDFSLLLPGVGLAWFVMAAWLDTTVASSKSQRVSGGWSRVAVTLACLGAMAAVAQLAYAQNPRHADQDIRAKVQSDASAYTIQEAILAHPADFHLHALSSAVSLREGDAARALALGRRALALAPRSPTALSAHIHAAFASDAIDEAQRSLKALCHNDIHSRPECLRFLLRERGRKGLVAAIIGEDVALTLALAEHLRQKGERNATSKVLDWARGQFPDHLGIQEALVESWLRLPDATKALDDMSIDLLARSVDTEDDDTRRRLQRLGYLVQARLVEREGRDLEARHLYQEAATLDETRSTEPLLHAARVLLRLKDHARLDNVLDKLRNGLSRSDKVSRITYHRLRSKAEARLGRLKSAVRELHKAIRLAPTDPSLYESLASVLTVLGDERGAKRAQEHAARLR